MVQQEPDVIPATSEAEVGGSLSKVGQGKSMRPHLKNKSKRGGVTQAIEHLLCKHIALSSNSSPT
jgi:hypothetical protein